MIRRKALFVAGLMLVNGVVPGYAQDCTKALEEALEQYGRQEYAAIIALLESCPPDQIPGRSQRLLGLDLLAQAYVAEGQPDSARPVLNRLLDAKPGFAPATPQYQQAFVDLVADINKERARRQPRSILRSRWFWIGGVAASSVAAYLIFGQSEPALLPGEPPDPPGGG